MNQMIPYFSAYLGHGKMSDTDWYLTGVTDLLGIVGDSFRTFGLGGEDDEEKC